MKVISFLISGAILSFTSFPLSFIVPLPTLICALVPIFILLSASFHSTGKSKASDTARTGIIVYPSFMYGFASSFFFSLPVKMLSVDGASATAPRAAARSASVVWSFAL